MTNDYYASVRLILASASPARAELLRAAGYTFDVVVTDVDESIRPGESPSIYVRRLAADKSAAAQSRLAITRRRRACAPPVGTDAVQAPPGAYVVQAFGPAETVILGADT